MNHGRDLKALVIGLGAAGTAALGELARRGADVLGLERFEVPNARGSSHGHSRVIRKAYFEHPSYVPLLHRAYDAWAELERDTGTSLMTRTGCLSFGPPDHELVVGVRTSVQHHGLPHAELDARAIRLRFPALRPGDDDIGIYEDEGGVLRPERCVRAAFDRAIAKGARARVGAAVTSLEADDAKVVAMVDGEPIVADVAVLTVGAWLGRSLLPWDAPLSVMRQTQHWFAPRPSLGVGALPCFIHAEGERAFYGLPAHDERGVKVCRHYGGELVDPDAIDRTPRPEDEAEVRSWMRRHLPEGDGPLEEAIVCMYGLTPDAHYVLGHHPEHSRIVIAGGFSGHGFKLAPVVGECLAEIALEGGTRHDVSLFDPSRFRTTAGS